MHGDLSESAGGVDGQERNVEQKLGGSDVGWVGGSRECCGGDVGW